MLVPLVPLAPLVPLVALVQLANSQPLTANRHSAIVIGPFRSKEQTPLASNLKNIPIFARGDCCKSQQAGQFCEQDCLDHADDTHYDTKQFNYRLIAL